MEFRKGQKVRLKTFNFKFQPNSKKESFEITVSYHTHNAFIINKQQHDFDSHEDYKDCLAIVEQLILYNEKNK